MNAPALWRLAAVTSLALVTALPAAAQVDQRNRVGGQASGDGAQFGQSFTPQLGLLNYASASLRMSSTAQPAAMFAEVRQGSGFGGALLGTSNIVSVSSTGSSNYTFSFATPVTLVPNATYTLRFATSTNNSSM